MSLTDILKHPMAAAAGAGLGLVVALTPVKATMKDNVPKVEYAQAQAGEYYGDYKEVTPEELGLRIEYGPSTRERKHSNRTDKDNSYFYDVRITNNKSHGYAIEKIEVITPRGKNVVTSDILVKYCGSDRIDSDGTFFQPDRKAFVWGNAHWPIAVQDIYYLLDSQGSRYKVKTSISVP